MLVERHDIGQSPPPHLLISRFQCVLLELQQESYFSWNAAGWCHLFMQTGDQSEFRSGHMASVRWHWDNSILLPACKDLNVTKVEGGNRDFSELLPKKKQQLSSKRRLRWVIPILTHLWRGCRPRAGPDSAQWEELRPVHFRFLSG